jgi:RimJ/RimL family protein N-acetyltransferase
MQEINASDRFDIEEMQAFMRRPELYWQCHDAFSPPPEQVEYTAYLAHPDIWTIAGTYRGRIIGYVVFNKRTSVGAEIHTAFRSEFRGVIARAIVQHAIGRAFTERGLLKLWAIIPVDNKPAIVGARHIGFRQEGRLTNAILRACGLTDLLILGLGKAQGGN